MQVELGAQHSYRKASEAIKKFTGNRRINNHSRIHKVTREAGDILESHKAITAHKELVMDDIEPASELIAVVDGGYVHDADNKGHNFEAMIAKIYRPENIVKKDKHHTEITNKHCAGSAKNDSQATMIRNVKEAAQKDGLTEKTTVIALADGAKNCWNILESLLPHCTCVLFILDWFHIGKYVTTIKKKLSKYSDIFDDAHSYLWNGNYIAALQILSALLQNISDPDEYRIIKNFHAYIDDNQARIVNYNERKEKYLVYSSHVAESTVEHFLNARARKKQKMSWSRKGLHPVLQLRASKISGSWEKDWREIISPTMTKAA